MLSSVETKTNIPRTGMTFPTSLLFTSNALPVTERLQDVQCLTNKIFAGNSTLNWLVDLIIRHIQHKHAATVAPHLEGMITPQWPRKPVVVRHGVVSMRIDRVGGSLFDLFLLFFYFITRMPQVITITVIHNDLKKIIRREQL